MGSKSEPIHSWDGPILLRAFLYGLVSEAVAIAPAVLSPWGHAGPESPWGWLGLLLNAPGLVVISLMRGISGSTESVPIAKAIVYTYSIQALIFSYVAFVWLRRNKLRAAA